MASYVILEYPFLLLLQLLQVAGFHDNKKEASLQKEGWYMYMCRGLLVVIMMRMLVVL